MVFLNKKKALSFFVIGSWEGVFVWTRMSKYCPLMRENDFCSACIDSRICDLYLYVGSLGATWIFFSCIRTI